MSSLSVLYNRPSDGTQQSRTVALSEVQAVLIDNGGGSDVVTLRGTAASSTNIYIDCEGKAADLVNAKFSRAPYQFPYWSRLSAAYTPGDGSITVESATDLGARADDVFAIFDDWESLTDQEWLIATAAPSGNVVSFRLGSGNDLSGAFVKGALVVNLSRARYDDYLGDDKALGLKAQAERPAALTATVTSANGQISVAITEPTDSVVTHIDVYVRASTFTQLQGHWIPDVVDNDATSGFTGGSKTVNITTYGGGSAAGGGSLASGTTYYVAVVAKDASGRHDVNEGAFTAQAITVAAGS